MEHHSKFPDFPIEIIERIIDDLENDIAALTAVSETCHALLPICRKHLFRCIDLSPRGPLSLKNLSQLLRYNPDIGLYVRKLKLHLSDSLDNWFPSKQDANADNILALSQVQLLESLQIVGPPNVSHFSCTLWNDLHPILQRPILDRMYSPSLTELNISRFILPFATFRSCTNLSILTIKEMVDYKSAKGPAVDHLEVPSHPIPQLRSLTVLDAWSHRYASSLIQFRGSDGHPTIRFDKLKTLAVHCYYFQDVHAIKDILSEAGELEAFAYKANTPEGCYGLAGWINVSAYSTLTTLKVIYNVMSWSHSEVPLKGLCHELDLFPRNNVLEVLEVEVDMSIVLESTREEQWGRLDSVLSRGFSRLRRVAIGVIFQDTMGLPQIAQLQQCEEISRTHFPCLRENAAVELDFSARSKELVFSSQNRTEIAKNHS